MKFLILTKIWRCYLISNDEMRKQVIHMFLFLH